MKNKKLSNYLDEINVSFPNIQFNLSKDDVDLSKNKKFCKVCEKSILKEIINFNSKAPNLPDYKNYIDINFRSKSDVSNLEGAVLIVLNLMQDKFYDKLSLDFIESYIKNVNNAVIAKMPEVIENALSVYKDFAYTESYIDFSMSLEMSAKSIYEDCQLLNINSSVYEKIDSYTEEYINYTSAVALLHIYRFIGKLNEFSKQQIIGNMGTMEDFRDAVKVVFHSELLSVKNSSEWLNKEVIKFSKLSQLRKNVNVEKVFNNKKGE